MVPLLEIEALARQDAIGGAQQQRQSRVNQVDLRQRDRQVSGQHDAFAQHVVDDVEQRGIFGAEDQLRVIRLAGRRHSFAGHAYRFFPARLRTPPAPRAVPALPTLPALAALLALLAGASMKLYGGHGPVSETTMPAASSLLA